MNIKTILIACITCVFLSCTDDDVILVPQIQSTGVEGDFIELTIGESITLSPVLNTKVVSYSWLVGEVEVATGATYLFESSNLGTYKVLMNASNSMGEVSYEYIIKVIKGKYLGGIIVTNEGPFQNGSASVMHLSDDLSVVTDAIYKKENGLDVGNILQSLLLHGDQAFLVLNNSQKIEVVNRYTFINENTISEHLINPRYAAVINDKLYVSNWGDTGVDTDDYIAVFDVETLDYEMSISVVLGPENMEVIGNTLYVAHQGAYGYNNKISVINTLTNTVASEITVGDVPNSMAVDSEGDLWVLCGGIPSWTGNETFGSLHKINAATNVVSTTFNMENAHPGYLTIDGGTIFYAKGANVYMMMNTATELPTNVHIETEAASLYSLTANSGHLFATDAKDYASKGTLFVYDYLTKETVSTITTGILPNGVYFNN
ncbi:MAG: YncE family protein [Flavobacteriaceae bacterium]|nr:YncE family protein [Flavobacteriaceae bacterium]